MRKPPEWTQFARYPVTTGTVLLAAGVSIAWWAKVDITPVLDTAEIQRGEVWRLVTDVFPHVNVVHLLFNVMWVWTLATLVEEIFGHAATLGIFVLFAIGSSAAEFALLQGGVGLSGVVYGLFGMLLILGKYDARFAGAVDRRTTGLFLGWFVFCIVTTVMDIMPVGNIAHGVGLVLGLGIGLALSARRVTRLAAGATMLLTLALVTMATFGRPYVNLSKSAELDEARAGYDALQENRNEDAVRWLADATRMRPADAGSWFNLAIAYDRVGRRSDASAAYDQAYQLDPNGPNHKQAYETRGSGGRQ